MSLKEEVIKIISKKLKIDASQITEDKSFIEDLGADSLDVTDLNMSFEECFGCEIPEEDGMKLKTVGDVIRYLDEKKK